MRGPPVRRRARNARLWAKRGRGLRAPVHPPLWTACACRLCERRAGRTSCQHLPRVPPLNGGGGRASGTRLAFPSPDLALRGLTPNEAPGQLQRGGGSWVRLGSTHSALRCVTMQCTTFAKSQKMCSIRCFLLTSASAIPVCALALLVTQSLPVPLPLACPCLEKPYHHQS